MGFFEEIQKHAPNPTPTKAVEQTPIEPTPPTEPTSPVNTPLQNPLNNPTPNQNSNFANFLKRAAEPRQSLVEPPPVEPKPTAEPEATTTQAAEEEKPKGNLTPAQCKSAGQFIAEVKDYALPKLIAVIDKKPDEFEQYKADKDAKQSIADAWSEFLAESNTNLTPGWKIVIATAVGYGIPLGMVGFERILKYLDERKAKKQELEQSGELAQLRQFYAMQMQQQQQAAPVQQQQPQQPVEAAQPVEPKPTQPVEAPPPVEAAPPTEPINMAYCLECSTPYKVGEGFAKGKKAKYYDKFCSLSCTGKYTSKLSSGNTKTKKNEQ
jgi:hypothetical protein